MSNVRKENKSWDFKLKFLSELNIECVFKDRVTVLTIFQEINLTNRKYENNNNNYKLRKLFVHSLKKMKDIMVMKNIICKFILACELSLVLLAPPKTEPLLQISLPVRLICTM